MMHLDPNFAPEGCIAVASKLEEEACVGCVFYEDKNSGCKGRRCLPDQRPDRCDVIFKPIALDMDAMVACVTQHLRETGHAFVILNPAALRGVDPGVISDAMDLRAHELIKGLSLCAPTATELVGEGR